MVFVFSSFAAVALPLMLFACVVAGVTLLVRHRLSFILSLSILNNLHTLVTATALARRYAKQLRQCAKLCRRKPPVLTPKPKRS